MAKYVLQKVNKLINVDEERYVAKFTEGSIVTLDEIAEHIEKHHGGNRARMVADVMVLTDCIAEQLKEGNTVRIPGLGDLSATLALDSWKEVSPTESQQGYVHAGGIHVRDVHFRASKELLRQCNHDFHPQRSRHKTTIVPQKLDEKREERKALLTEYLHSNNFILLTDYMELTGMKRTSAYRELKQWTKGEEPLLQVSHLGNTLLFSLAK